MSAFDPLRTLERDGYVELMSSPWFRPYAGFSYRPITWQGRVVLAVMVALCLPLAIASLHYAERDATLAWVAGVLFVLSAGIGHAVVLWKIERDDRRP